MTEPAPNRGVVWQVNQQVLVSSTVPDIIIPPSGFSIVLTSIIAASLNPPAATTGFNLSNVDGQLLALYAFQLGCTFTPGFYLGKKNVSITNEGATLALRVVMTGYFSNEY